MACSGCKRHTRPNSHTFNVVNRRVYENGQFVWKKICPLDVCEAPVVCHAHIGIGVCTLGTACVKPEGHDGLHSYGSNVCNKHKGGCPR